MGRRPRPGAATWRLLATAPWTRGPGMALRAPGTALAVAGAALVVAFVAGSWPLFLGSVVRASQQRQVDQRCPWDLGATVVPTAGLVSAADPERVAHLAVLGAAVGDVAVATPGLGQPVATAAASASLRTATGATRQVQLLARTGAVDQIELVAGSAGAGDVLAPDVDAGELALVPGASVELQVGSRRASATVGGVYRDLAEPLPDAWCSQRPRFLPDGFAGDPPPPVLLVERRRFDELTVALAAPLEVTWEVPALGLLHGARAARIAEALGRLEAQVEAGFSTASEAAGGPPPAGTPAGAVRAVTSTLPTVVQRSMVVARGLESGLAPTVAGASCAGVVLLLAAGWFWSERRSQELALLRRLGVGPVPISCKALLEMLVPVVTGAAAGLAAAVLLVAVVGPGDRPEAAVVWRACRWVAGSAAVGLAGAAAVAGLRSAWADRAGGATGVGRARRWAGVVARLPWEVVAVAVAVRAGLGGGGGRLGLGEGRLDLDGLAFALPVVAIVGAATLLGRVLRLGLAAGGSRGGGLPVVVWLGMRRLAARPAAPALFTGLVVASVGVLVFANGASASLERSLEDKARLAVGADALVRTVGVSATAAGAAGPGLARGHGRRCPAQRPSGPRRRGGPGDRRWGARVPVDRRRSAGRPAGGPRRWRRRRRARRRGRLGARPTAWSP